MLVDILEGMDHHKMKILRIEPPVLDWKIGQKYSGTIDFTLLEMDNVGMTVNVTNFEENSEKREKSEEHRERKPLTVVPYPS